MPFSFRTKKLHFIVLVLILASGWVYAFIDAHILKTQLADSRAMFASSTRMYTDIIDAHRTKIKELEAENNFLTGSLTTEQKNRMALERTKTANEEQINTLTKLTTTDPELLKKYSKIYFLSENYVPPSLNPVNAAYVLDPAKNLQVLSRVSYFLDDMLAAASQAGVQLRVASAYRSFGEQKDIKSEYRVIYGAGTANQFSADQGYSEHQLGTTLDFTTPALRTLDISFEKTTAFVWLSDNAYKYGFILSYPRNNGYYQYEPWHWRFVGKALAKKLHDEGKYFYEYDQRTIDEYLIKLFDP